jgi:hypothetical protein
MLRWVALSLPKKVALQGVGSTDFSPRLNVNFWVLRACVLRGGDAAPFPFFLRLTTLRYSIRYSSAKQGRRRPMPSFVPQAQAAWQLLKPASEPPRSQGHRF